MGILSKFPAHPVFIALLFWLSPYEQNWTELIFAETWRSGVFLVVAAAILTTLIWVYTKNWGRAGLAASLILFAILFYGELFDSLYITSGGILSNFWFATGWIGLLGFLIVGVLRENSDFKSFTLLLNVMLFVVLLPPTQHLMSKSSGDFLIPQPADYLSDSELATLEDSGRNVEDKPDIFFLIFDRFASDETLLNRYGYDNSSFSDALRRQGFYVADEAHANYTKTAFSLASSLNLTHLDFLSEKIGEGSGDWRPAHSMIRNHQVGKYLVDRNYQYLHIGSAWGPTRKSALAHVNYSGATPNHKTREYLNEFELYILSDTLIDRIVDNRITGRRSNLFRRQYERVKLKFDYLRSIPQDNSPRFIFAHLLLPIHPSCFRLTVAF